MTSRDLGYLRDIRDAAHRAIYHITGLKPETVADNPYLQDGVVRCLILMGEAAKNLSPSVRERFPEIDWPGMIGLRNIVNRDLDPVVERLSAYLKEHG